MLLNYDCLVNLCWYLPIQTISALSRANKTLTARIWAEVIEKETTDEVLDIGTGVTFRGSGSLTQVFGLQFLTGRLHMKSYLPLSNLTYYSLPWVFKGTMNGRVILEFNSRTSIHMQVINNICQPNIIIIETIIRGIGRTENSYYLLCSDVYNYITDILIHPIKVASRVDSATDRIPGISRIEVSQAEALTILGQV